MAQGSFYYPFKLAGLASTDEAVRRESMREFEKDVRAVWAAKDLGQTHPASDAAQRNMFLGSGHRVSIRNRCIINVCNDKSDIWFGCWVCNCIRICQQ